jgi:YVTN family beta-propeller protein
MMRPRFLSATLVLSCAAFVVTACWGQSLVAVSARTEGAVKLYSPVRDVLRLVTSVPAGKQPGEMCLDPGGTHLFVGEVAEKQVGILDLASKTMVGTISDPGIKSPDGCTVSPDGKKLYLVDKEANIVFVFNTATRELIKKIEVGEEPRRALFSRDGKTVIVTCAGADNLTVMDAATDTIVRTVKTGHGPQDLAFTPDGKLLVVGLIDDDAVGYFKGGTLEFDQEVGTVQSPQHVVPSKDGQFVFVSGHFHGVVGVMNLRPNSRLARRLIQTIPVGSKTQWGLTMSADGKYLYATVPADDVVSIVDLQLMKSVFSVPAKGAGAVIFCK